MHGDWPLILSRPDWYLSPEIEALRRDGSGAGLGEFYDALERLLAEDRVAIGTSGRAWDEERRTIDTVVVHHTSRPPGISWETLSAVGLYRLYAAYYANPTPRYADIRGRPLYSGHHRGGTQVFYGYHWIVRGDGSAERLLQDHEIGWHAGDWAVNCRSVGVVFDNDYEDGRPSRIEVEAAAELIRAGYPGVPPHRIVGHRETSRAATCPGSRFPGDRGWKLDLLGSVAESG